MLSACFFMLFAKCKIKKQITIHYPTDYQVNTAIYIKMNYLFILKMDRGRKKGKRITQRIKERGQRRRKDRRNEETDINSESRYPIELLI